VAAKLLPIFREEARTRMALGGEGKENFPDLVEEKEENGSWRQSI